MVVPRVGVRDVRKTGVSSSVIILFPPSLRQLTLGNDERVASPSTWMNLLFVLFIQLFETHFLQKPMKNIKFIVANRELQHLLLEFLPVLEPLTPSLSGNPTRCCSAD